MILEFIIKLSLYSLYYKSYFRTADPKGQLHPGVRRT